MAEIKHSERYGPYLTSNSAPAPFAATASQNNWGAFRAFSESLDDDISFTGLAAGTEQWVQIKLDAAIRIWAFRIACRTTVSAKDAGQVPKNIKVQGSVDGTTFEDIQVYTDVGWEQFVSWDAANNKYDWGDSKKIEITSAKEYQYYRFSFGECQAVSSQKLGSMTPTSASTVKLTLIDLYQVEGDAGAELTGIRITHNPDKTRYEVGTELDETGLEVMADMSDGTAQAVTDYTLSGYDSATAGQKTVTVAYQGYTATFAVLVYELSSIKITTPPAKIQYNVGDTLDLTGMVVTATYSDDVTETVTDYTVSGFESTTAGTKTVTVAYGGETATFAVTVEAAAGNVLTEQIGSPNPEDVTATLDLDTGQLTISGTGATKDYAIETMTPGIPSLFPDHGSEIKKIVVEEGITHLGSLTICFLGVDVERQIPSISMLEEIILPDSLISLGEMAITGVYAKKKVMVGSGFVSDTSGGIMLLYTPLMVVNQSTTDEVYYVPSTLEGLGGCAGILYNDYYYEDTAKLIFCDYEGGLAVKQIAVLSVTSDVVPVAVPSEYKGKPVVALGTNATNFPPIASMEVSIPSSIKSVYSALLCLDFAQLFFGVTGNLTLNIHNEENEVAVYDLRGSRTTWADFEKDTKATVNWLGLPAKEVQSLAVTKLPTKTRYQIDEELDTTGLEITATYSDGSEEVVTAYELSGFDSTSLGEKTITVTYVGITTTFVVTVYATESVEITTLPNKVLYNVGESLDTTGMVVTATYTDGVKVEVTDYTLTGYDSTSAGIKVITVSYDGKSVTFEVTVQEIAADKVTIEIGNPTLSSVTASLDLSTGVMTIRGIGDTKDFTYETGPVLKDFKDQVKQVVIEAGITSVGAYAFHQMGNLKEVIRPESLVAIGDSAFSQSAITSFDLSGITELKDNTFSSTAIKMITIPSSLKKMGSANFTDIASLTQVVFEEGLQSMGYSNFASCTNLEELVFPNSLRDVSGMQTGGCASLKRLVIPSITNIPDSFAPGLGALEEVIIGDGVLTIGDNCFASCDAVKTLTLGGNIQRIGMTVIAWDNAAMETISIPESVEYMAAGCIYSQHIKNVYIYSRNVEMADAASTIWNQDAVIYGYTGSTAEAYAAKYNRTFVALDAPSVQNIRIDSLPMKTRYLLGESFDAVGLVVAADLSDGTSRVLTDYTVSGFDGSTIGTKTITVTYETLTATFTVVVYDLSSIAVTAMPEQTRYQIGEFSNMTGLEVTATYSDGVTETIADYTLSDFDGSSIGEKTITVTYQGKTTTFAVVVYGLATISVMTLPDKKEYQIGEPLDTTGMIVAATYTDGVTEAVTGYSLSWFDNTDTGRVYLTVTFQEKETEFYVTVVDPEEEVLFERILKSPDCYVTLLIHWKNGEFADVTNNEIKEESLVLEESICEDDTLRYGGCIANRFEIDVSASQFNDLEPSGSIHVTVKASGTVDGKKRTSSPYHLFDGTIESAKRQRNLNVRKIIAYDDLYYKGNMDIISWYYQQKFPMTIGEFRRQMMEYVGIPMVETVLSNDAKYFPSNIKQDHLYVKDVLRDIAETEARFGIMDRQGRFVFRRLEPNGGPLKGDPIKIDLYKSIDFKEGKIYKIQALQPMDYIGFASVPTSAEASLEYYWIENNVVFTMPETQKDYNAGRTPWPRQGQWRNYSVQQYEAQQPGNPRLTVGKNVEYTVRKTLLDGTKKTWTINSYIFYRKLRGIQSMTDTVGARNGPFTRPEGEDDKILSYLKNNSMRAVSIAEGADFNPETDAVPGTMYFLQGLVSTDNGMQSSRILLDHQYHTRVYMGAGSFLTRSARTVEANAIKIGADTVWKKIGNLQWERHDLGLYLLDPIYTEGHAFYYTKNKMYRLEGFDFRAIFDRRDGDVATVYPDHLIHVSRERERENLYDNGPVQISRDNMIIHRLYDEQSEVFESERHYEAYDVISPDDYYESKYASFLLDNTGYNGSNICIDYFIGVARSAWWVWSKEGIWLTDMSQSTQELLPSSSYKVSTLNSSMVFTINGEYYAFPVSISHAGYADTGYLRHRIGEYEWEVIFLDDESNPLGDSNNYNYVYMKKFNNEIYASGKKAGGKVYRFDKATMSWQIVIDASHFDGNVTGAGVAKLAYSRKKNIFYYLYTPTWTESRLYRCENDGKFQFKEVLGYRHITGLGSSYDWSWVEYEDGYGFVAIGSTYYYTLPFSDIM